MCESVCFCFLLVHSGINIGLQKLKAPTTRLFHRLGSRPDLTSHGQGLHIEKIRSEQSVNFSSRGIIKKSTLKQLAEASLIALWLHRENRQPCEYNQVQILVVLA